MGDLADAPRLQVQLAQERLRSSWGRGRGPVTGPVAACSLPPPFIGMRPGRLSLEELRTGPITVVVESDPPLGVLPALLWRWRWGAPAVAGLRLGAGVWVVAELTLPLGVLTSVPGPAASHLATCHPPLFQSPRSKVDGSGQGSGLPVLRQA